jgi:hypothetical protein
MRYIILVTSLFLTQHIYAQNNTDTVRVSPSFIATMGKTYLDSVEIDITKTYLDSKNIQDVKAIQPRDEAFYTTHQYATLIIRKKPTRLLPLEEFKSDHIYPANKPLQFVINKELISDTSNVRIELSAIKSISILKETESSVTHESRPTVILINLKRNIYGPNQKKH